MSKKDGKILILGSGRAGTTYLAQLLTRCGVPSGMEPFEEPYRKDIRAGCEIFLEVEEGSIRDVPLDVQAEAYKASPTLIKAPNLSFIANGLIQIGGLPVSYIIIPVRDLVEATASRLSVGCKWNDDEELESFEDTLDMSTRALGMSIEAAVVNNIPYKIIHYPDFTQNKDVCREVVKEALDSVGIDFSEEKFFKAFTSLYKKTPSQTTNKEIVEMIKKYGK
jgi:hypothetical protein